MRYFQQAGQVECFPTRTVQTTLGDGTCVAEQLRLWVETREGSHLWQHRCTQLPPQVVYHALKNTCATRFGLLLTECWFTLRSTYSPLPDRLVSAYEEAACGGLCFWVEGGGLFRLEGREFLWHLHTLPGPFARAFPERGGWGRVNDSMWGEEHLTTPSVQLVPSQ